MPSDLDPCPNCSAPAKYDKWCKSCIDYSCGSAVDCECVFGSYPGYRQSQACVTITKKGGWE